MYLANFDIEILAKKKKINKVSAIYSKIKKNEKGRFNKFESKNL